MSMTHEQYEQECERIRQENDVLLDEFAVWLQSGGLGEKSVRRHCDNLDFYINHFLLYEDVQKPEDGAHGVGYFLGYWFIKKSAWASPSAIKANAASLKKFYTFMVEKGRVSPEALADLKLAIKEEMDEWLAAVARYYDS